MDLYQLNNANGKHSGHSVDKMRVQMQTDALKKYL